MSLWAFWAEIAILIGVLIVVVLSVMESLAQLHFWYQRTLFRRWQVRYRAWHERESPAYWAVVKDEEGRAREEAAWRAAEARAARREAWQQACARMGLVGRRRRRDGGSVGERLLDRVHDRHGR